MSEKPSGGLKAEITLRLDDYPKILAGLRHEVATILLEIAESETPPVAARLREIAFQVDAGLREREDKP